MRFLEKLLKFLVVVLPLVLLLGMAARYVTDQVRKLSQNVHVIVGDQLSVVLGRRVHIGKVEFFPLGRATATNIVIPELATPGKPPQPDIITAEKIVINYHKDAVLQGMGARSIKNITIHKPYLRLVRQVDGHLNVMDLIQPSEGPAGPAFAGELRLVDARVDFIDRRGFGSSGSYQLNFDDMEVLVDATQEPSYTLRLQSQTNTGSFQDLMLTVILDPSAERVLSTIQVSQVNLKHYADLAGLQKMLNLQSGTASVNSRIVLDTANDKFALRNISASVTLSGVDADVLQQGVPIRGLSGKIVVADERAALSLVAKILDSDGRLTGTVSGIKDKNLDLALNFTGINTDRLLKIFELPQPVQQVALAGKGSLKARITGKSESPIIQAQAQIPYAKYTDYIAEDISVSGSYADGRLDINSLKLTSLGGKVSAAGIITGLGSPSMAIDARAWVRGCDLAMLSLPEGYSAQGGAGADVIVSGTLTSPNASAILRLVDPHITKEDDTVDADAIYAKLALKGDTIEIEELAASGLLEGELLANGRISREDVDIRLSAKHIDCGEIASLFEQEEIDGFAFFDGRVYGKPDNPWVDGLLESFVLRYGEYEASYLSAKLSGNLQKLNLDDGVVLKAPTDVTFTAELLDIDSPQIRFDLDAVIKRLDIQNTLAMLKQDFDVSGVIAGDLHAAGTYVLNAEPETSPLQNAKANLLLNLTDGTAYGYPLQATVDLDYTDDLLNIAKATFKSERAEVTANGNLQPFTRELNVDFNVLDADLARFSSRLEDSVTLTGVGQVSGSVTGLWDDPLVHSSGSIEGFAVNGLEYEDTAFDASYQSGLIRDAKLDLKRGEQLLSASAESVNPKEKLIEGGRGVLKDVSIQELWEALLATPAEMGANIRKTAGSLPTISSGKLDGELLVSGKITEPDAQAQISITNLGLDRDTIESIELDAISNDGDVNVSNLLAKIGDGTIWAAGAPFYSKGKIDSEFSIRNLDLNSLRPFLGQNTPRGILEAELIAQGKYNSPFVRGSLELVRPGFGDFVADGIRAGDVRISLDRSELSEDYREALAGKQAIVLADDAVLALANHQVNIDGFVPWDWSAFNIPDNLPLQVRASLHNQDVSSIAELAPFLDEKNTTGVLDASFDLSGTVKDIKFGGQMKLEEGQVAVNSFTNLFNNINVDLGFVEGNRLAVNQLSIGSDLGGRIYVKPGSYIKIGGPDGHEGNIHIAADKLRVGEKNIAGFSEDIIAQIDAGIAVQGPLMTPKIFDSDVDDTKGGIQVSNAKFVFAIPEETAEVVPGQSAFNPEFDLSFAFGNSVLVQPPALKLEPNGGGRLTGTLNRPDFGMDVGVKQGHMVLAARRMRVTPGGSLHVRYAPPADATLREEYKPEVDVNFKATTSLTANNAFGKKERYQVFLTATGGVPNLQVDLQSEPAGLSKEQILAELGHFGALGTGGVEIEKELTNVISAVGSSTLFSPIETIFVEQLGFEQFTLDYSKSADTTLYFSRALTHNLYLSYFQTLKAGLSTSDNSKFEIKLGYRPRGMYQITVGVNEEQKYSADISISKLFN